VAVDFTPESSKLVRYASSFEGESALELFHALNTYNEPGLRSGGASAEVIAAYRQAVLQDAQERLIRFSDSLDTRRNRAALAAGCAEPARHIAVHQAFTGSDLVIVGKRRRPALVDVVLGSVARRVVVLAGCDVLVVGHDHQAPTGTAAKHRMQSLLGAEARLLQLVRKKALGAPCAGETG
jgi:nucleotide-binding universal stress UspA family protein